MREVAPTYHGADRRNLLVKGGVAIAVRLRESSPGSDARTRRTRWRLMRPDVIANANTRWFRLGLGA
jgi:hypothetical protein